MKHKMVKLSGDFADEVENYARSRMWNFSILAREALMEFMANNPIDRKNKEVENV